MVTLSSKGSLAFVFFLFCILLSELLHFRFCVPVRSSMLVAVFFFFHHLIISCLFFLAVLFSLDSVDWRACSVLVRIVFVYLFIYFPFGCLFFNLFFVYKIATRYYANMSAVSSTDFWFCQLFFFPPYTNTSALSSTDFWSSSTVLGVFSRSVSFFFVSFCPLLVCSFFVFFPNSDAYVELFLAKLFSPEAPRYPICRAVHQKDLATSI